MTTIEVQTQRQDEYVERQTRAVQNAQAVINQLESDGWEEAEKYVVPLNEFTVFVHTGGMSEWGEEWFMEKYADEPYVTELEPDMQGKVWRWSI